MKQKIIYIFTCILGMTSVSKAQNFEPSSQALGYLNDKNVTVDHFTGTFHYDVPLFKITSGNYTLPVSLNYPGDISVLSKPNTPTSRWWYLQADGVVTRVCTWWYSGRNSQNRVYIHPTD